MTFETFDTFEGEAGFFIKVFFINDKRNGNFWKVVRQSIRKGLETGLETRFHGKTAPFIIMPDYAEPEEYGHPDPATPTMIDDQEPYRKGDFYKIGVDEGKGGWVIIKITDSEAENMIRTGKIKFVSPSIQSVLENENGEDVIWKVNHLAGVTNPAYGYEAQITGTCTGKPGQCLVHLSKQASCAKAQTLCDSSKIPLKNASDLKLRDLSRIPLKP